MSTEEVRLTGRQRVFVEAYCGRANGNATAAARVAGYGSPMQRGYELTRKPEIQGIIRSRIRQRCASGEELLSRLKVDSDELEAAIEQGMALLAARLARPLV